MYRHLSSHNSDKKLLLSELTIPKREYRAERNNILLNEKIGKNSRHGHGRADVPAFPTVTTYAEEDTAKKTVLLHFRPRSGIPVVLSLSPANAEGFHQQIGEALKRTKNPS